jgi:hypothetical protein
MGAYALHNGLERNFPVQMGAAVITLPATEASPISVAQVNSKTI